MNSMRLGGMGWRRDLPDFRDLTDETTVVADILSKSKRLKSAVQALPASVELKQWCSPIEDQGQVGSCTANAGVALLEYYERRAFGKHIDASRLFLYKATRNLLQISGDQGAYLRTTMKAMAIFGVPPEQYWVYDSTKYDEEPPAFCYSFAENYKSIKYFRLDPPGKLPSEVLTSIKQKLAAGLPSMFGFSVYSSIPGRGDGTGDIPFPSAGDSLLGGHAVVAIGYNDGKVIGKDKGALLIRNSWSTTWGEKGYGWLPYTYVLKGLA
ncbi:MAG: hypothetical protein JW795_03520, partial [Chitinivibrionales bacterium]|nr:hypothetical protein [Chitinivibrionales bacterium]